LRAQGEGFKSVADQVRFAVARQLLSDTDIPLAQVSAALSFSEPAAFTRFCKVVRAIAQPPPRQREAKTLRRDGLLSQPIKL
jgi:transcriptional regulator GlxA family with amidase domain